MTGPGLDLRPLTARSVILSVLLGSHPPLLPVSFLVAAGEIFGIADGTMRVALSRLTADGDVVADGSFYRLSSRLLDRQRRQDEGLRPGTKPWRGGWELAIAGPDVRTASERAALGADLLQLRLGELRSGVWVRPDNLQREWPDDVAKRAWRFESRSGFDEPTAAELVGTIWDLTAWTATAEALLAALAGAADPAERFIVAAAAVRHLQTDPMIPHTLLPPHWPGSRLRGSYAAYQREFSQLLREQRDLHQA
jgi:phenylacetic acid degradation operon negative regulatory protein